MSMAQDETAARGRGRRKAAKESPEGEASENSGPVPEFLRRAMTLGLSSLFTTEEAFRKALGDTVPKDWVDFAALQSDRARAEFLDRLVSEFGRVLENVDLTELAQQVFEGRTIEVNAKIRLAPADESSAADTEKRRSSLSVAIEDDALGKATPSGSARGKAKA